MATQFEYFGFQYEIIEGKNNEVALIEASNATGRVLIPKTVEFEGKKYTVTKFGGRKVNNYFYYSGILETDKRKKNKWIKEPGWKLSGGFVTLSPFTKYIRVNYEKDYPCNSSITSVVLPDTINELGEAAFSGCIKLEEVNLPSGITKIPNRAFCGANRLQKIILPNGITSIGESAFFYCCHLKEITIPSSVKTIDRKVFTESGLEINILNEEGEVLIHPEAILSGVSGIKINYLGKKEIIKTDHPTNAEKKNNKNTSLDLEKLIQAALVDGVVTDKERAILLKKVKEAGGDTDEFELLLDARIYEAQQKNAPKKEKETPKAEKKVVEKKEEPKKEKETPKEVKQAAKTAGSNDPGREVWENMEKDVKPALQILDKLVAGMPYVQDGTYQINYDSKSYIGFAKNGKANNFATFAPQPKALVVNAWGMEDSEAIEKIGKALPNFEHKVTSRNVSFHTFKFSVDKAPAAEQLQAALAIIEMARKNYEK